MEKEREIFVIFCICGLNNDYDRNRLQRIINLNNTSQGAVINRAGRVPETSMDDVEISIAKCFLNSEC